MDKNGGNESKISGTLLFVPLFFQIVFLWIPVAALIILAFFNFKIMGESSFVFTANFIKYFTDPIFWSSAFNSLALALNINTLWFILGPLAAALLLARSGRGVQKTFLSIFMLILLCSSPVIISFIYNTLIFNYKIGYLNSILYTLFHIEKPVFWLMDKISPFSIVSSMVFSYGLAFLIPSGLMIYMAALRGNIPSIPEEMNGKNMLKGLWRPMVIFLIAAFVFSLTANDVSGLSSQPSFTVNLLLNMPFVTFFSYFQSGTAAVCNIFILIILFLFGILVWLIIEKSGARITISPDISGEKPDNKKTFFNFSKVLIIFSIIISIFIVLFIVVNILAPFLLSFYTSIMNPLEIFSFPRQFAPLNPTGENYILLAKLLPLLDNFINTLAVVLPSAFLLSTVSIAGGYALGYFRKKNRGLFFLITSSLFITPAALVIPFFMLNRSIGIINTHLASILPWLGCSFGIFLSTLFFRGLKDKTDSLSNNGNMQSVHMKIIINTFGFFILLNCVFYIMIANNLMVPLAFNQSKEIFPLNLALITMLGSFSTLIGSAAALSELMLLPYILPIAGLILLQVLFLPGIMILIRKKGKQDNDPDISRQISTDNRGDGGILNPIPGMVLPGIKLGNILMLSLLLTFILLSFFIFLLFLPFRYYFDIYMNSIFIILFTVIFILCFILSLYTLFCQYRIHKALVLAAAGKYPVSPWKALVFSFIPVFNFFWLFMWTNELCRFVNAQKPARPLFTGVYSLIVLFGSLLPFALIFTRNAETAAVILFFSLLIIMTANFALMAYIKSGLDGILKTDV